jgi:hypothetical protein
VRALLSEQSDIGADIDSDPTEVLRLAERMMREWPVPSAAIRAGSAVLAARPRTTWRALRNCGC